MTAATAAPWLQLPLDERFGDSLHDATPARRNGVTAGELTIVDDEQRGPCLELSGGTVTLPALDPASFAEGFTLVVWAKPAADGRAVRLGGAGNRLSFASVVPESGAGEVVAVLAGNFFPGIEHRVASVDEWCFFALAMTPTGAITILSPSPREYAADDPTPTLWRQLFGVADSEDPQEITLGSPEFRGRLSQLRIYDRALTIADVEALRAADVISARRAVGALPIAMSLEDEEAAPVLLIDSRAEGHTMTLRVRNSTRAPVHLALPPAGPTADDWHFALAFRPGTLTRHARIAVVSPGWTLTTVPGGTVPNIVEDRLLLRADDGPVLPVDIVLAGLVADAAQGTRTTRIQLEYQNLQSAAAREQLRGTRTQQLTLINHQGRRQIPVHVGTVGGRALTLDQAGALRLHIANILPDTGDNLLRFGERSCIQLSFDEGDADDEWTLATGELVKQIEVRYGSPTAAPDAPAFAPVDPDDSRTSRWTLPLAGFAPLAPRQRLELLLTNVVASGVAGPTNLYIDLVNIPGYWDQRFYCPIEKVTAVAAEPAIVWRPLALQNAWQADPNSPPEVARDRHDIVHLRGAAWCRAWALLDRASPTALALPPDCLPTRPLAIPGHATVWPTADNVRAPLRYSDCHVMRNGQESLEVDAYLATVPWRATTILAMPATARPDEWAVVLRLDGICYLAGTPAAPVAPPETPQTPISRREGPAGPADGYPFDDSEQALALGRPITRMIVRAGEIVDAIQTFIADTELPQHGGDGGGPHPIDLEPGDVLTEISGYTGTWHERSYVVQITLQTRDGRTYGPFGEMTGVADPAPFHFAADPGQHIAAFHGATIPGQQSDGTMSSFVTSIGVVLEALR
jgi:hypothetical protein